MSDLSLTLTKQFTYFLLILIYTFFNKLHIQFKILLTVCTKENLDKEE